MKSVDSIETLDMHTAGEPLRIVTRGLPPIPGDTMLEKRRYMAEHLDHWRRLLMLEPRGHADMYGAVLTDPVTEDGDCGVLFLHNQGYSTMCGHGIIALVHAGVEYGLFPIADPSAVRIDTPAGQVLACAHIAGDGRVTAVTFRNVPAFVLADRVSVPIDGSATQVSVAYGGAFYAYVDARPLGLQLLPGESYRLISLGRQVKQSVLERVPPVHPAGDDELNFLYGTIFTLPGKNGSPLRQVCIFAEGELDRSPTGTGVSGRAALLWSRGQLAMGEDLRIESIIGTSFTVRCLEPTLLGETAAVITQVTGSASITGEHRFRLDGRDPLPQGFLIR